MARTKRLKDSFQFLQAHVADEPTRQLLADSDSPFFMNGPEAFDHVCDIIITEIDESELEDMETEWVMFTIVKDVGTSENTIKDAVKLLTYGPAPRRRDEGAIQITGSECKCKLQKTFASEPAAPIFSRFILQVQYTEYRSCPLSERKHP